MGYLRQSKLKRVQITSRDVELFDFLERYRWLTREQISKAMQWGMKSLERRVLILEKAKYLDSWQETRYTPMYHAISNGGAQVLAERRGLSIDKFYWRWQNKNSKPGSIEHASLTADTMIDFLQSEKTHPTHTILEQKDVESLLPLERRERQHPFAITLDLEFNDRMWTKTVNPDQVFGVVDEQNRAAWISLEADRGNHPVKRGEFGNHRQVFPKLVAFYEIHRHQLFKSELGFKTMRQLWIVHTKDRKGTQDRIRNMQEQACIATEGQVPNLFLFGSAYDTAECASLLDFEFENAARQPVGLTE